MFVVSVVGVTLPIPDIVYTYSYFSFYQSSYKLLIHKSIITLSSNSSSQGHSMKYSFILFIFSVTEMMMRNENQEKYLVID